MLRGKDIDFSRFPCGTLDALKYLIENPQFRKERLTFSNQWEALEFQIKKQDDEIDRLKNTQKVQNSNSMVWNIQILSLMSLWIKQIYGMARKSLKKINIKCNV